MKCPRFGGHFTMTDVLIYKRKYTFGAGEGNRTLTTSLGSLCSTTKLHLQYCASVVVVSTKRSRHFIDSPKATLWHILAPT